MLSSSLQVKDRGMGFVLCILCMHETKAVSCTIQKRFDSGKTEKK